MKLAVAAALMAGSVPAVLRWLRVAQREHYLAGSVGRFGWRWWSLTPISLTFGLIGAAAGLATLVWLPAGFITAAVAAGGPPGLGIKGKTSPLAWTWRLRRLAITVGVLVAVSAVGGWWIHPVVAVLAVVALPLLVDAGLAILAPLENRLGRPWVEKAAASLKQSGATVVAITGSYGKTSTKGYVASLVGGSRRLLASPASFNNRMGLARAINEHLSDGIQVFVAEMGTYGPGEIADLCSWIPPDVAVITAIGPVHLERFGSEEMVLEAKSEIVADAAVAVLNVDDVRLAALADRQAPHRRVIRTGTGGDGVLDVLVGESEIEVLGNRVADTPIGIHRSNLACALGVAVALDVPVAAILAGLGSLAVPAHRLTVSTGQSGVTIIDDTFNSNPAGARAALAVLARHGKSGQRVVVTPGMVELGRVQAEANREFARQAAGVAGRLIVVGRTNSDALLKGARQAGLETVEVANRSEAVAWVKDNLGPNDVVLYENDLPDHYP